MSTDEADIQAAVLFKGFRWDSAAVTLAEREFIAAVYVLPKDNGFFEVVPVVVHKEEHTAVAAAAAGGRQAPGDHCQVSAFSLDNKSIFNNFYQSFPSNNICKGVRGGLPALLPIILLYPRTYVRQATGVQIFGLKMW